MRKPASKKAIEPRRAGKNAAPAAGPELDLQAWIAALRLLPAGPPTEADVLAWVEGPLRHFFPFEKFLGAYGHLAGGRIEMPSIGWRGFYCS